MTLLEVFIVMDCYLVCSGAMWELDKAGTTWQFGLSEFETAIRTRAEVGG